MLGIWQSRRIKSRVLQSPILAGLGFLLIFGVIFYLGREISILSEQIRNQFVPGVQLARDIQADLDALQRKLQDAIREGSESLVENTGTDDEFFEEEVDAESIYRQIRAQLELAEENEAFEIEEGSSPLPQPAEVEAESAGEETPIAGKKVETIAREFDEYYAHAKATTLEWIRLESAEESSEALMPDLVRMTRSIQTLLQDVDSLAERSNEKLTEKLDDLQNLQQLVMWIGAAIAIFFIAILIWNATQVISSVTVPINKAVHVADQLSRGNMEASIEVDREDEIGELLRSMHHMLDYLREMADVAEAIATGNLGRQIDPRSELDLFGRAFRDMSENLRQMIGRVKEAANEVAGSATDIAGSSSEITRGAESQSASAEETLSTMVEIAAQIDSVAKSSQALAVNVDQTSSSIQEMAASIEQVAKNSTNLLASVDQTSSTIEEMAASIQSIEGKVRVVDDVSREAANIANTRGKELSQMIAAIGGAGKDIGKIVGIIEDIADQTNLLALNAAIEAAHAGDAGRGFAVVAEEVKRLSERSVASTRDIGLVVQNVQQSTDEATELTREILKQIVDSVNRTSELVAEVYTATQEQSSGAAQILSTSNHMQSVTRQLASAAKEQASGARDMMKAVEVMNRMTQQVADASGEQKQGGDLVVKAVERIAQIAQQNLSAAERLSENTQNLSQEAERLLNVAEVFTVDQQQHKPRIVDVEPRAASTS